MEFATALGTEIALSALSSVINKLATYLGGDVTPEEMQQLKLFLLSEISVLIDEVKSDDLVQSRPLLEKLQESALQVDDLLDLYEYNQIKNQVRSSSTNFFKKLVPKLKGLKLAPKSSLRISLEKLLDFVEQVEKKHPFIKFAKTNDQPIQQKYKGPEATTSTPTSPYFGRDEQYESIVKLLLDESHADSDRRINEIPVIAIKGMGGFGKSLTAQIVCKDKRITDYFDKPIWVHVTTDFDVERLTKKIIECIENEECPQSTDLGVLQTSLKKSIKKRKRFLLVLDDVWCEDKMKWDLLVGPLNETKGDGSKIIMTTRLAQVARLHAGNENVVALDELKADDCWSILKYYAFNNSKHVIEDQNLVNVGNQIISKARSSPLALKVVGSSLRDTSVNEWEKILERDVLEKAIDLLLFSFQRLPSHLQRCFAYCSLFPKGYIFKEQLLIPLWIAQGYIANTNNELTLEEEGSMYISDLLSYSFFEKKDSSDYFVIHDLLHDLAERTSRNLCHRIEHSSSLMNIPENCIHLSMNPTAEFKNVDISDVSKLINLRSLIILGDASCTNIFRDNSDIFQILSKLRALFVKSDGNIEVLSNINVDQLKHLRYLHVKYDKKLPKSFTKLYHLQFFYLKVAWELLAYQDGRPYLILNTLPQGFGNLINLRTLKFLIDHEEVDYLKCNSDVISIENLKSLQNVSAFHPEKDNVNGMVPLKNTPLCGSFRVCDLENVKSKEDAEKAMLKQKKYLNDLTLQWGSSSAVGINDQKTCEVVLEGLEPHQNLKSLTINGYQGVKIANWMERKSQPLRLQSLILSNCESMREINFLPPGLRELHVECCKELTQLPPFGSTLKKLVLRYCPVLRLQSMPNNSPSLEFFEVRKCPMLITDESLLVKEVSTANRFPQADFIITDEPLLVPVLVQQQAFSSIKRLHLFLIDPDSYSLPLPDPKPFPPSLKDNFHEFSSLEFLLLEGFKTLPNLVKLSSLREVRIRYCPDVELLPDLPVSLKWIDVRESPKLQVNYKREGPLHETISHVPNVSIW